MFLFRFVFCSVLKSGFGSESVWLGSVPKTWFGSDITGGLQVFFARTAVGIYQQETHQSVIKEYLEGIKKVTMLNKLLSNYFSRQARSQSSDNKGGGVSLRFWTFFTVWKVEFPWLSIGETSIFKIIMIDDVILCGYSSNLHGKSRGGSTGGSLGAAPSEICGPLCPPPQKKVQDKAFTCQDFQKACSAVVILMLSCFVTF